MLLDTVIRAHVFGQHLRVHIGALAASQQLTLTNSVARDIDHKMVERRKLLAQMVA